MLTDGELVTCQTNDQLRLHGYLLPAKRESELDLDAVLISHAIGGNYYNSRFLNRLALACHDSGLSVLMANNRGHDVVNYLAAGAGRRVQGAAFEKVSDCQFDYESWLQLLADRGYQRIVIIGHSLGAIKAIFSQAHRPHKNVAGIVAFSASRLRYQDFFDSENRERFLKFLHQAKELCHQGNEQQLLDVDFPFPILISAGTYVDKYGEGDRYNWLKFIKQVAVPSLLVFGERELADNAAFQGLLPQIEELGLDSHQFNVSTVPRANHYYTGCQQVAAELMVNWFQKRFQEF